MRTWLEEQEEMLLKKRRELEGITGFNPSYDYTENLERFDVQEVIINYGDCNLFMKQPRQRSIPRKVSNSQETRLLMKLKRFYRPRSFSERLKRRITDRPNYYGTKQAVNNEFD